MTEQASSTNRTGRGRGLVARFWWIGGLALAGVVATLAAAFASGDPDGLDSVAIQHGFEATGQEPGFSIIPGYVFPGLDGTIATVVAGLIGIGVVFLAAIVIGRLAARRRRRAG